MDATAEKELNAAVVTKARGKMMEKEGKALSKTADETLLPLMLANGIKNYALPGYGKVNVKSSGGSMIIEQTLREEMLKYGIPANDIDRIISPAKKVWESTFIDFRAEK